MYRLLLILLAAGIASCSATRFAYNRLDWIAGWQLDRYVELNPAQRALFDTELAALWRWHRTSELPRYVDDLEALAATIDGGRLDRATLDNSLRTTSAHAVRLYERLLPPAARLLATLDDTQITTLHQRVDDDGIEKIERYRKVGVDGWRDEQTRDMLRRLRRWTGASTAVQRERIAEWAQTHESTPELWFDYRRRWTEDFFALLEHRRAADFPQRLRDRLEGRDGFRSDALVAAAAADREHWLLLMMELHAVLEPRQRDKLVAELRHLARNFALLAVEAPPDN